MIKDYPAGTLAVVVPAGDGAVASGKRKLEPDSEVDETADPDSKRRKEQDVQLQLLNEISSQLKETKDRVKVLEDEVVSMKKQDTATVATSDRDVDLELNSLLSSFTDDELRDPFANFSSPAMMSPPPPPVIPTFTRPRALSIPPSFKLNHDAVDPLQSPLAQAHPPPLQLQAPPPSPPPSLQSPAP